jgi:Fe2+ transport system protein B
MSLRRESTRSISENFRLGLGVPVIAVNAKADRGKSELADKVDELAGSDSPRFRTSSTAAHRGRHARIFARYNFISNAVQDSVKHNDNAKHRVSEKIDRVLTT